MVVWSVLPDGVVVGQIVALTYTEACVKARTAFGSKARPIAPPDPHA
jgi:hypothetical protein